MHFLGCIFLINLYFALKICFITTKSSVNNGFYSEYVVVKTAMELSHAIISLKAIKLYQI